MFAWKEFNTSLSVNTNVKVFEVFPPIVGTKINKDLDVKKVGGAISPEENAIAVLKGLSKKGTKSGLVA